MSHENSVLGAGFAVGASLPDSPSAGKWLSAHNPDAAILDVSLEDESSVELAQKLTVREIPLIAVSSLAANTPGVHQIFRSVPWLEKPVTPSGLQLTLRSIF
ncbi:MAG TPA: hypothetical protein VLZ74_01505 [Methylocella sp.]|nr:hypothetical protein [Methylocella sp.]